MEGRANQGPLPVDYWPGKGLCDEIALRIKTSRAKLGSRRIVLIEQVPHRRKQGDAGARTQFRPQIEHGIARRLARTDGIGSVRLMQVVLIPPRKDAGCGHHV